MCLVGALNVGSINLYFDQKLKTNQFWPPKNHIDDNKTLQIQKIIQNHFLIYSKDKSLDSTYKKDKKSGILILDQQLSYYLKVIRYKSSKLNQVKKQKWVNYY